MSSLDDAASLMKTIDKSFQKSEKIPYRFVNKNGILVDFKTPTSNKTVQKQDNRFFSDVIPLVMDGMQWLEKTRLLKETVIADNGKTAEITTIHPLEYAIYKYWLSKKEDRDFQKHTRDLEQSKLVTQIIKEYMLNIDIEKEIANLKHFKKEVVLDYMENVYKRTN